ncbi:MAG: AI-2E family transporter [Propionibacterium sp.]|nr:AI-2E family transporter [Propionibacterium sp.]
MNDASTRTATPRGLILLLALAALVVALAGLNYISGIVAPAFFALTLVLTGRPLHKWMLRKRMPRLLSAMLVMVLLYLLLLAIVGGLSFAIAQLTLELPKYADTFTQMWDSLIRFVEGFGINADKTLRDAMNSFDVNRIVGLANTLLSSLSNVGSQVGMLLIILFFLTIDTQDVRGRVATLIGARPHLAEALSAFSLSVRKYWFVTTVFGLIVALLDVVALGIIGVPLAWTWGILSFVTNYIPNIGFVLGLVPPALMALLVQGPIQALAVVIAYSVINFVLQTIVQPKFTGDAVGLNTGATFLSLALWATVLGPFGALLAVPLTSFFKAILIDADPDSRWMNAFLTNEKPARTGTEKGPESVPGVLALTTTPVGRLPRTESGATVEFPARTRPQAARPFTSPRDESGSGASPAARRADEDEATAEPHGATRVEKKPDVVADEQRTTEES